MFPTPIDGELGFFLVKLTSKTRSKTLSYSTLNIVFNVTNSICLAQYLFVNHHAHVVSPTLNVNLTQFVISWRFFWALYIYNVAITLTY